MDSRGIPAPLAMPHKINFAGTPMVGNDFFVPRPRVQTATPAVVAEPIIRVPIFNESSPMTYELEAIPADREKRLLPRFNKALDYAHRYSVGTFAALFLIVGASAIQVASTYYTNQINASQPVFQVKRSGQPVAGYNMSIPANELDQKLKTITTQPIRIQMGSTTETIDAGTVKNWLNIVTDSKKGVSYIHVKEKTVLAHLKSVAESTSKAPKNQISVTHGGVNKVVVGGVNGVKVGDTSLTSKKIAQNLFSAQGFNEVIPTEDVPFQAVTPAVFGKMIEVNLSTKQMYLYENGNITKTYAISAGAPETPTPTGQFKIKYKRDKQDMRGYNPDGTKYFQPNVKWISYFEDGGYAIHGNYWRPTSWFGVRNSSHGCVSLPDHLAKEVYDWSPSGTNIIIHQ